MLILKRCIDEDILIGDDIVVRVIRIDGQQVHLGIEAPRDLRVDRRELADRIRSNPNRKQKGAR